MIPTLLSLMALPQELRDNIIQFLDPMASLCLKLSCTHFNDLIKPLTKEQLLIAETDEFAEKESLLICNCCVRIRTKSKFADNQLKKGRDRGGSRARMRFCIDCGIGPPASYYRYSRGSQVVVRKVLHVICEECELWKTGAIHRGMNTSYCAPCWTKLAAGREALSLQELEKRRRRRRTEREQNEMEITLLMRRADIRDSQWD